MNAYTLKEIKSLCEGIMTDYHNDNMNTALAKSATLYRLLLIASEKESDERKDFQGRIVKPT